MNASLSGIYSDLDSINPGLSFSSSSLNSALDRRLRSSDVESANDLVMAYVLFKCFGSTSAATFDVVYNLEDAYNMITNSTVSNAINDCLIEDDAASTSTSPGIIDSMFTQFLATQPMRFFDASGRQVPYLFETNPDVSGTGSWNLIQGDTIEIPIQFTFTAPVTLNSVKDMDGELSGNTNTSVIINTNDTFSVRLQVMAGQASGYTPPSGVSTFAGSGTYGYADGIGSAAEFQSPFGMAIDSQDNIYVSDGSNKCIRKITPNGIVTTVAGIPGENGSTDGAALSAKFSNPTGLALDTSGNLYICDSGNDSLRMLSPAGIVSTISTDIIYPTFCAVNPSDPTLVYVSDSENSRVVSVNVATGVVTTIADALFTAPGPIEYYDGHLYVCITNGGGIPASMKKIRLADSSAADFPLTGPAIDALTGIHIMPNGTMYITADGGSIYKVMPNGTVTLLAGTGVLGYVDGNLLIAQFHWPADIANDSSGNLYVAGNSSPNIRKIIL
jgi:sugar lactone lactonase YvrE